MNLNITNLLNTLQGYYNPKNSFGERYTGKEEGLSKFITAYGLSGAVTNDELTQEHLSKVLFGSQKITISSETPTKFSYKVDEESGKVIIFGNNLTITVEEGFEDTVEVVGISNVVNGSTGDDKITLIGYDNRVNAEEGNDNVEVHGEDNTLKDSENNIFAGIGGQTLIFNDKTFEIGMKDISKDKSEIKMSTSQTGEMTINAQNAKIIAKDDAEDNITLIGNNNYLDTSDGADNIVVKGEKNTIATGIDDKTDSILIEGKNNTVIADDEDIITHKGTSGSFNLSIADSAAHYLVVEDNNGISHKFSIERTSTDKEDVVFSYSVNEDNQIVFTCNNVRILAQDDADEEIIVKGNNNHIDVSAGDDKLTVIGDKNMIISGDGRDLVTVEGQENHISGDDEDEVYYTNDSGSIVLTNDDDAAHYINVNGASYLIQRNPAYESAEEITVSYELNSQGIFEIKGNNFSIIEVNDVEDNIKITGNNNYIDVSSENDNVTVIGDGNSITAGTGDDNVVVIGKNNQISGDEGKDTIASSDNSNTSDNFEIVDKIVTLTSSYQAETVKTSDKKSYTLKLTDAAKKAGTDVNIVFRERDGKVIIEADGIIVEAGKGQEDDITFKGNNSRIFAADKNDNITVTGDKNIVDGWTGDDKITVTGRENKAYGFLGNDDITIIQRESTESEIANEAKKVSDKDEEGNIRTNEEKQAIAENNLAKSGANKVDGEWGEDIATVKTTSSQKASVYKYTDVSIDTEIINSLSQTVKLKHDDDEKRIVVTDDSGKTYSYTIKNHVSTNNPFVGDRLLSYDFIDVTDEEGNITKKLVIQGNYIDVKADDGQEDNIEIIGDGNHIDLGDEMDYLEAKGNYNLLFVGKGNDYINVKGDENEIYGEDNDDTISVNGSKNKVDAGAGNDKLKLYGDSFKAFGGDGDDDFDVSVVNSELHGGKGTNTVTSTPNGIESKTNTFEDFINDPTPKPDEDLFVLSPDKQSQTVTIGDLTFDVTTNIENLAGNIYIRYRIDTLEDGKEQIVITGSDIAISLKNEDKAVNVKLLGSNILFGSCGKDDIIEVVGHNNKINAGRGSNTIKAEGNHNQIDCGRSTEDIDNESINNVTVKGDYNTVENINDEDEISLTGVNNVELSLFNHERKGGSFVLTKALGTQTIVMDSKRAYEFTIYNPDDVLEDEEINVRYSMDDEGNIHFYADNVKIRVIDNKDVIQGASIVLHGNNSYVQGGNGQDAITVYGNNNTIDGWYNDDSFVIYGENNKVRGYYGDDTATLYGDKNNFNGEQGNDTVNIAQNSSNKYENVEKVEKRN